MMAKGSTEDITLKVFRLDPERDERPRFDRYRVPFRPGMTVLESLFHVLEHQDGSLAFRYSCRGAVCGACAMYINGSHRLACQTQVSDLKSKVVTVGPLPFMRVIRDLVVDLEPFFAAYEQVMPYLVRLSGPPEKEHIQSPAERARIDEQVGCLLCASCYSSCPSAWTGREYLGPSALQKAYRFCADSRDEGGARRLAIVGNERGVWRCHTVFNCVEACPKDLNPTVAIQELKKLVVLGGKGVGQAVPDFVPLKEEKAQHGLEG